MATKKCTDGKDHKFEYSKTVITIGNELFGTTSEYNPKDVHISTCIKCGEVRES